jgi:O-methyltransferase
VTPKFLKVKIHPFWCMFFTVFDIFIDLIHSRLCRKMKVGWKRAGFVYKTLDYVRLSSLELVAREIYANNIQGAVAELGVYEGDFAKYINQIFPDRKLYLFDTFKGFREEELQIDKSKRLYHPEYDFNLTHTYSESTIINSVLNKMRHKENCIIRKGFFPETTEGVDDIFSFVNIDVDLSIPIYNGLCWFFPRLVKGGYIFVHDYNQKDWPGAKEGVKKFTKEYDVPYFPLSDVGASAVFFK